MERRSLIIKSPSLFLRPCLLLLCCIFHHDLFCFFVGLLPFPFSLLSQTRTRQIVTKKSTRKQWVRLFSSNSLSSIKAISSLIRANRCAHRARIDRRGRISIRLVALCARIRLDNFSSLIRPARFKPCCIKIFRGNEWRFG